MYLHQANHHSRLQTLTYKCMEAAQCKHMTKPPFKIRWQHSVNGPFPTSCTLAWTPPIFQFNLHCNLSYTPVKFCDCSMCSCVAIRWQNLSTETYEQTTDTWTPAKVLKTTSVVYIRCHWGHILPRWYSHKQVHKMKTIPALLSRQVIRGNN